MSSFRQLDGVELRHILGFLVQRSYRYASLNHTWQTALLQVHNNTRSTAVDFTSPATVQLALTEGYVRSSCSFCALVATGSLATAEWALGAGWEVDEHVPTTAARHGRVDMLQWLQVHVPDLDWSDALAEAALTGHLAAVRWLHTEGQYNPVTTAQVCEFAAEGDQLEILQYLHEEAHFDLGEDACDAAAEMGHLQVLQWLHEHGCPWSTYTLVCAATTGQLDTLRYAMEHGCPANSSVWERAAAHSQLHILDYAHATAAVELRVEVWETAALFGRVPVLQFGLERGYPILTADLCADSGTAPTLMFFLDNNCPATEAVCVRAVNHGKYDVLRCALERGIPWHPSMTLLVKHRGLEAVQIAREHGVQWTDTACYHAAHRGALDILRYAHEHGAPWDPSVIVAAAQRNDLAMLTYLCNEQCPVNAEACAAVAEAGQQEILQRLLLLLLPPPS